MSKCRGWKQVMVKRKACNLCRTSVIAPCSAAHIALRAGTLPILYYTLACCVHAGLLVHWLRFTDHESSDACVKLYDN